MAETVAKHQQEFNKVGCRPLPVGTQVTFVSKLLFSLPAACLVCPVKCRIQHTSQQQFELHCGKPRKQERTCDLMQAGVHSQAGYALSPF